MNLASIARRFASHGRRRAVFGNPGGGRGVPSQHHPSSGLEKEQDPPQSYFSGSTESLGSQQSAFSPATTYMNPTLVSLLSHNQLVVERQIEYMNLFLSFEQHNKYALYSTAGVQLGWMIERQPSLFSTILRQFTRTHRPFALDVMDMEGNVGLTIKRGFSFINSHVKAILPLQGDIEGLQETYDVDPLENGIVVGESVQHWHLWRRRYDLFANSGDGAMRQAGAIDAPFLAWDFSLSDPHGAIRGSITRTFKGLFREVLTDTGVYVVDWASHGGGQGLPQRAAMLALCASIDFDYFSRHSTGGAPVTYVE